MMGSRIRRFFVGLWLLTGLLSGAHALYAGGNPLGYVDPDGLSPKGLPQKTVELMPLEGGGGGVFGGPTVSGPSPFGGAGRGPMSVRPVGTQATSANPYCPPEVQNTLVRIRAGQGFPHRNDGAVFQNREGALPAKPHGYYREWVHPTLGVQGPGSQRVVTGQGGEAFYTPDHYRTFIPVP